MSSTRASIRYANAILDIASTKNVADVVSADMTLIANTVTNNTELRTFLENPTLGADTKHNAILAIFSKVDNVTKSLFRLLLENKRFENLGNIAIQYNNLFDKKNNIETAYVTTAVPVDSQMETLVLNKIATFSDKKINLKNIIDPTIIGGFILRIGDQQYNASIANRLQTLKRELSN
jgi:F-type H+-transporting ATPase subunit delta